MDALVPQPSLARRHDEDRAGRHLEDSIELLLRETDVVQKDERALLPQVPPHLRVGGLSDPLDLEERLEDELDHIRAGLVPRGQEHDAIVERCGCWKMGELAKERGLSDAGFTAHLDDGLPIEVS